MGPSFGGGDNFFAGVSSAVFPPLLSQFEYAYVSVTAEKSSFAHLFDIVFTVLSLRAHPVKFATVSKALKKIWQSGKVVFPSIEFFFFLIDFL